MTKTFVAHHDSITQELTRLVEQANHMGYKTSIPALEDALSRLMQ